MGGAVRLLAVIMPYVSRGTRWLVMVAETCCGSITLMSSFFSYISNTCVTDK